MLDTNFLQKEKQFYQYIAWSIFALTIAVSLLLGVGVIHGIDAYTQRKEKEKALQELLAAHSDSVDSYNKKIRSVPNNIFPAIRRLARLPEYVGPETAYVLYQMEKLLPRSMALRQFVYDRTKGEVRIEVRMTGKDDASVILDRLERGGSFDSVRMLSLENGQDGVPTAQIVFITKRFHEHSD